MAEQRPFGEILDKAGSSHPHDRSRITIACAASVFFLLVFLAQGVVFIRANSQTSDEATHLAAGYSYLTTGDFRLNPEHPPLIKLLSALPVYLWYRLPFALDPDLWEDYIWTIGRDFLYGSSVPADDILTLARVPNLLLGLALIGLVGWWAFRLWGEGAAVVAVALAALEPNLVAHACLVTTDVGATFFTFLASWLLWEYVGAPSWGRLAGIGIATGLALASKYSGIVWVGILGIVIGCHILAGGFLALPCRGDWSVTRPRSVARARGIASRLVEGILPGVLILCLAALVLLAVYFFGGFRDWRAGLWMVRDHQAVGHPAFFLGKHSHDGWWSYFPVAFMIKTPVGSLLLLLASLVFYRAGQPFGRRDVIFLLLPVALLLMAMTQARINIGLRHILPVYPFLFVAASRLATVRFRRTWLTPLVLAIPVTLTALSSLRVAPHQLAYFNELVGGPGEGYRYLSDSNIDWGQDLIGVKQYMDREGLPMIYLSYSGSALPSAYGIHFQYAPVRESLLRALSGELLPEELEREVFAISVMNLQGVGFKDVDRYGWLHRRTPVAKIGYSIFVYDLTGDADGHVRLAEAYLKDSRPDLAVLELRRALRLDASNAEAMRLMSILSGSR